MCKARVDSEEPAHFKPRPMRACRKREKVTSLASPVLAGRKLMAIKKYTVYYE